MSFDNCGRVVECQGITPAPSVVHGGDPVLVARAERGCQRPRHVARRVVGRHIGPMAQRAEPLAPDAASRRRERWRESLRRLRGSSVAGRFGFESVLIVLSVLVGLALNEWRELRAERARAETALVNFRRELAENLATLERRQPKHAALAERLQRAAEQDRPGETAFASFRQLMPEGGLDNAPLRDAAWETALSTGALRLLDYEPAALLSETYLVQRRAIEQTVQTMAARFLMPENFQPALRRPMLQTHGMIFVELSGQESYLIDVYRQALRRLDRRSSR